MATFFHAYLAKEKMVSTMMKKRGIAGVGIGFLNEKNRKQGACLIVYTHGNLPSIMRLVPQAVGLQIAGSSISVPVRAIHSGGFRSFASIQTNRYKEKIRPVKAGYSVGRPDASGTAGLIVTNFPERNQLYVLSNNHVLNSNNSPSFTETLQPGGADGGRSRIDTIGRLDRFVALRKTGANFVDGATSIPLRNSLLTPRYATVGELPGHVSSYRIGDRMKKVGRTTGLVKGVVESIHTDIMVDYGDYGNLGTIRFRNQTVIKGTNRVSLPGDSGSVWLRERGNFAAAVNFAGTVDGRRSIAYPVEWFMQVFQTRVATAKGVGSVLRASNRNHNQVRPLTPAELRTIQVRQVKKQTKKRPTK
ncbi:UNVERIFIED_CONTAM: hypothetical protein ABID98_001310 [Brevibacillus sp. OAP136]